MNRLAVNEDACIGCHLCEIWCVVAHSKSNDLINCFKLEKPRPESRVTVHEIMPVTFPLQCRQCDDPACVYSCPSGALKRVNGSIQLDYDRCRSCWTCILVCPFGAVRKGKDHPIRCDLCEDREIPACVQHCPNEAISLEETT